MTKAIHHGCSRAVVTHPINTRLHEREAAAPGNFAATLEEVDPDQAQELTKDPYALQFLTVDSDVSERELEQRLVDRVLDTMREMAPLRVRRTSDALRRGELDQTDR